jgi:hypothetical protein
MTTTTGEPGRDPVTPFIAAALAERDRRARDPKDISPWPKWQPQPDMIPPLAPLGDDEDDGR